MHIAHAGADSNGTGHADPIGTLQVANGQNPRHWPPMLQAARQCPCSRLCVPNCPLIYHYLHLCTRHLQLSPCICALGGSVPLKSLPLLMYLSASPYVSLFLSLCISIPLLLYLSSSPYVSLIFSLCSSLFLLLYLSFSPYVSLFLSFCTCLSLLM